MQAGTHHWKMHLYIIHRLSPAIGSYVVHTDEFGAMKWVCKALCLGEKWGSRTYALINFKSTPIDATWSQKVPMLNRLCHVHMYLTWTAALASIGDCQSCRNADGQTKVKFPLENPQHLPQCVGLSSPISRHHTDDLFFQKSQFWQTSSRFYLYGALTGPTAKHWQGFYLGQ